jgi:hypothetical protein
MNEGMLAALLAQYKKLECSNASVFAKDTSEGTTVRSTAFEIATEILTLLEG